LRSGADDCLAKPFDPEELVARIGAVLRRTAQASSAALEVMEAGELRLFPGARVACLQNERVELTSMECEILEELIRSRGRSVSRDYLSLRLNNRPATHVDRAVDTHVSRLRRKIGKRRLILSVPGTGYQLSCPPYAK